MLTCETTDTLVDTKLNLRIAQVHMMLLMSLFSGQPSQEGAAVSFVQSRRSVLDLGLLGVAPGPQGLGRETASGEGVGTSGPADCGNHIAGCLGMGEEGETVGEGGERGVWRGRGRAPWVPDNFPGSSS